MATYVIPPGAWLSGSALHPHNLGSSALHPHAAGNSPLHPHTAGNSPLHPHLSPHSGQAPFGAEQHPHLQAGEAGHEARVQAVQAAGQPWRGTDPAWVYQGGPQALLAQALRRTHSKIVRPTDPRLQPSPTGRMPAATTAASSADPLWRWGSEFRVHAAVADLAWRLRLHRGAMYLTQTGALSLDLSSGAALTGKPLEDQIDKVQRAAIEREDRLPEILAQGEDFWSFFRVVLGIDNGASPLLEEVLAVAWQWATPLVMGLKNDIAALRPVQCAPRVLPVIATPAHGSLPSGHATMAALTSEILAVLLFKGNQSHLRVQQLDRLVRRIAFNRVVAGVHFPVDSAAGYALGLQLAGHFVGWATGGKAFDSSGFDLTKFSELNETGKRPAETGKQAVLKRCAAADGPSEPLALLWNAARREAQRGRA